MNSEGRRYELAWNLRVHGWAGWGGGRIWYIRGMGMGGGGVVAGEMVRPGVVALVAYRVGGRRPGAVHDEWLRRDVESRWYPLRSAAASAVIVVLLLLVWLPVGQVLGLAPVPPLMMIVVAAVVLVLDLVAGIIGHERTVERFFAPDPQAGHFRPYTTDGLAPPD